MGKCIRWTPEEDAFLTREYGKSSSKDIADALGRTAEAIRTRAIRLKLKFRDVPDNVPQGFKYCTGCKQILPLDSFYNQNSSKDGKYHVCIKCAKEQGRKKREMQKEENIQRKIDETNKKINEKTKWKNSQTFICKICGRELPGENFSFNNVGGQVNCNCNSCRAKKGKIAMSERIKNGRCW